MLTTIESEFSNHLHRYLRASSFGSPREKAPIISLLKTLYQNHKVLLLTSTDICIREFIVNYKEWLEE